MRKLARKTKNAFFIGQHVDLSRNCKMEILKKGMSRHGSVARVGGTLVSPTSIGALRSASKANNTLSTQRGGSVHNEMQSPCHLCAGSLPTNGSMRLCAVCSKPTHLACMLRRFRVWQ